MRRLLLALWLIAVSCTASYGQIPANSICMTPDHKVYGHRGARVVDGMTVSDDCTCDLPAVLYNGSSANGLINLYDAYQNTVMSPNGVQIVPTGATIASAFIGIWGGTAQVQLLEPGTAYYATTYAANQTASRAFTYQDRSGEIALNGDGIHPYVSLGPAAGSFPSLVTIDGDDRSGTILFHVGTFPTVGLLFTVTFTQPYNSPVRVTPYCANDNTSIYYNAAQIYSDDGYLTHFDFYVGPSGTPFPFSTVIKMGYVVTK